MLNCMSGHAIPCRESRTELPRSQRAIARQARSDKVNGGEAAYNTTIVWNTWPDLVYSNRIKFVAGGWRLDRSAEDGVGQ